ncbi:two-component sensor histidine kinase [Amycolatopsis coloradensis]|uniref:histidine kinase n=1 Tax=Amycolatopsis coloradensis TaxID=76021 RepID=A0A1R0KW40_9PSEU|nr:ATP-binding protein [Amycolatopsis coloradensis]OLZ53259.1 two-component sensor histidine kinase [Amycolatopsis coloradensis]
MKPLRLSLRTKLTALYGGAFLVVGLALLIVNYLLVSSSLPDTAAFADTAAEVSLQRVPAYPMDTATIMPAERAQASRLVATSITEYRSDVLSALLWQSLVALAIAGALAVLLGWLMASRVLRPLHAITSTARKLEAENLDRRIDLDGPDDELKELADTFDGMLDRLAVSFDSQKRFVANASHELRTPLAVQRTLVEVAMADPDVSPEVRKLGEHLIYTNERSERMIEGLLVLARSDRGLAARSPVRLDEVVATVIRSAASMAEEAGVTVEARLRPRTVSGDPVLVERLATNLVHNAITYNREGGWIHVDVGGDPALAVRNTGPRVPLDAVPALFEPFRRLSGDRTGDSRNAGLGLSIVRSIAKAHGGTAGAEPGGRGGGLVVRVRLP